AAGHGWAAGAAAARARAGGDARAGGRPAGAGGPLRGHDEIPARFGDSPAAVVAAGALGAELAFDLQLIAPRLPPFAVPAGHGDEMAYLRELTYAGAARRYGPRGPATQDAYTAIQHELGIIEQLGFPGYL